MQKRLISNQYLEEKWKDHQNELFGKKLEKVKTYQDTYKTGKLMPAFRSKSNNSSKNIKNYEIIRNNINLGNRLSSIYTSNSSGNYIPKTINITLLYNKRKWEDLIIRKDNKSFVQRLVQSSSIYDKKKFDEEFFIKQKYKSLISKFPLLKTNFSNTRSSYPQTLYQSTNNNLPGYNNYFSKHKKIGTLKLQSEFNQSGNCSKEDDTMFLGKCFINNFGECLVEFKLLNNQFCIYIKKDSEISYSLVFRKIEEILKLQRMFQSYEELINQFQYEEGNMYLCHNNGKILFALQTTDDD